MTELKKIYVHGWATDSRVWTEPEQGAIYMDLPGHGDGRLDDNKGWGEPTLNPGVEKLLSAVADEEKVTAIGWSLGAKVVMQAVAAHPEKFGALVLIGATPSFIERAGFPFGQKKAIVRRMMIDMADDPIRTLKRFAMLNFTPKELKTDRLETNGARDFVVQYGIRDVNEDFSGIRTALKALYETDIREAARSILIPTLVIHGTQDNVVSIDAGRWLAANLKNASFVEFKNTGHAPFITEKERFDKVVAEFFSRL